MYKPIITDVKKYGDFSIITREALRHTSTSSQRNEWVLEGIPFFDNEAFNLWRIYDQEGIMLHEGDEQGERATFLKKPFYIAKGNDGVMGGLWIAGSDAERIGPYEYSKTLHFHVSVSPENRRRNVATTLVKHMESDIRDCDGFSCFWGEKREFGQRDFFRRNGYELGSSSGIIRAIKMR
jgi:hypothetical protein